MANISTIKNNLYGLLFSIALLGVTHSGSAQTACATVKIVIEQRVTLERQAFEATLTIDNGLGLDLDDFIVTVWAREVDDIGFLTRTPNTPQNVADLEFFGNESDYLLFFKPAQSEDAATIASGASQIFTYLLIPTQEAALTEAGTSYEVGAYITYKVDGKEESIEVEPDSILVKPLPELTLEYFLPKSVIADNPNTAKTEASQPFDLGVRVVNTGVGSAQGLQIESFQPKIKENYQGLLVEFRIISSEVNGSETQPSLTVNFGELLAGHAEMASWQMFSTVFGRFIEARATFTHSDELGGDVTSVIDSTSVYRLVGRVDANSDGIPDLLSFGSGSSGEQFSEEDFRLKLVGDSSKTADFLNLHPSGLQGDGSVGTLVRESVANLSDFATTTGGINTPLTVDINGAPGGQAGINYSFVRVTDPRLGRYEVHSVQQRTSGPFLPRENFSLSTELAEDTDGTINVSADFEYYVDIFDIGNVSGGVDYTNSYIVSYGDPIESNSPPVIVPLPELPLIQVGEIVKFTVEAYDLDGDSVELSALARPADATLIKDEDASESSRAVYEFTWTAEEGDSVLSLVATDGVDSTRQSISFNVLAAVDLSAWLSEHGLTEAHLGTDDDRDGYNVLLEYVLNLDPTEKSTEGLPQVFVQEVAGESRIALRCDVLSQVLTSSEISLSALLSDDSAADVASWSEVEVPDSTPVSSTPGMTQVIWVDSVPISEDASGRNSRFIRLKADYTPTQ
jgi:hypothetical protein